jgi:general secretion pathway protein C
LIKVFGLSQCLPDKKHLHSKIMWLCLFWGWSLLCKGNIASEANMAIFEKYNWALGAVAVLSSSFLVAKTTNYFVEERLIEEEISADKTSGSGVKALSKKPAAAIHKDGQPIIARNLFNSTASDQPASEPASAPVEASPLSDAPADCSNASQDPSGATLRGTIVTTPKEFSNITVSENGSAGTSIYWVGDKAFNSDAEVYEVHARKVFFKRSTGCTYLVLGEQGQAKAVAPVASTPAPAVASTDSSITTEGISKTGENSYEISRDLINSKLGDLATLANEAKAIPNMKNGEFNGFKLYAIRSTSVFSQIGMKNGDILQTVNGEKIDSLEKAMGLLSTLNSASSVQIGLQRRGQSVNMDYSIK